MIITNIQMNNFHISNYHYYQIITTQYGSVSHDQVYENLKHYGDLDFPLKKIK